MGAHDIVIPRTDERYRLAFSAVKGVIDRKVIGFNDNFWPKVDFVESAFEKEVFALRTMLEYGKYLESMKNFLEKPLKLRGMIFL